MKAYVFPGQGAQFPGMGRDLYERSTQAKKLFENANAILGFRITDLMFNGTEEDIKQTKVTQPSIFLYSVILASVSENRFIPDMVAGHSLGEFSALVANKTLSFEDGLLLVSRRALAMQKACEKVPSSMAAIIGLDERIVAEVCAGISDIVVPANYNSPGQIVISGSDLGIEKAIEILKTKGAKLALKLQVGGAFHSPFMEPARAELEEAIRNTKFCNPICPVFQNVDALPSLDPNRIKANLVAQLTSPVRWTQCVENMISHGAKHFIEAGPGSVLQGLIKKINKDVITEGAAL